MALYNSAEVCELVGSIILHKLAQVIINNKLIGLYRDDGLALLMNMSDPEIEKFSKTDVRIFKESGLKIVPAQPFEFNLHL